MSFNIVDKNDRLLISVNDDGEMAISRYTNMTDKEKELIAFLYNELTGIPLDETMDFLNFEEEDNIFCA